MKSSKHVIVEELLNDNLSYDLIAMLAGCSVAYVINIEKEITNHLN